MTDEELKALRPGNITASDSDRTGKWWTVVGEVGGSAFRFYDNWFYVYYAKNIYFDIDERHATEEDLRAIFNYIFRAARINIDK